MDKRTKRMARSVRVIDREAMARAARWIIANKGGTWSNVGHPLRGMQPTLSRLQNKRLGFVSPQVFSEMAARLQRGQQGVLLKGLFAAALSPQADVVYRSYLSWMTNAIWRYPTASPEARYQLTSNGPEPVSAASRVARRKPHPLWVWPSQWDQLDVAEAERWRARYVILDELRKDEQCRNMLATFEGWMGKRLFETRRQEIAFWRIVEPLAEAADSGFMERRIDELAAGERRRYVAAGIAREKILMNRETGFRRAHTISNPAA